MLEVGKKYWSKISENWFRVIYINHDHKLMYYYHYKSKAAQYSPVIEFDIPTNKQLCSLRLIEKDLRDIKILLEEYKFYLSKCNEAYELNKTPKEGIIAKGLFTAIAIHYMRCFNTGSKRNKKLKIKDIKNEKNKKVHFILQELRNKCIAHADHNIYEDCRYVHLMPPYNKCQEGKAMPEAKVELYQTIDGGIISPSEIELLIAELQKVIIDKMIQYEIKIDELISKLDTEKVYKYIKKKKSSHVRLNDYDLKKLYL